MVTQGNSEMLVFIIHFSYAHINVHYIQISYIFIQPKCKDASFHMMTKLMFSTTILLVWHKIYHEHKIYIRHLSYYPLKHDVLLSNFLLCHLKKFLIDFIIRRFINTCILSGTLKQYFIIEYENFFNLYSLI